MKDKYDFYQKIDACRTGVSALAFVSIFTVLICLFVPILDFPVVPRILTIGILVLFLAVFYYSWLPYIRSGGQWLIYIRDRVLHVDFPPREAERSFDICIDTITEIRETRPTTTAGDSSSQYVATGSSVHGGDLGSLVLINLKIEDDFGMGQVSRLTPEVPFPESEFGGLANGLGKWAYAHCWPLDRDFYLCSYGDNLCYLDRFGNRELVCGAKEVRGASGGLSDPIPLRPRLTPPEIPVATYEGARNATPHEPATIKITNIYNADFNWPPQVSQGKQRIKWLRVLQFFPKNNDAIDAMARSISSATLILTHNVFCGKTRSP